MKSHFASALVGLGAGVLFGAGLVVSGMVMPEKVRGFLDFAGKWDPTLVFVMGGAVLVHAAAYRIARRRASPVFAEAFRIPTREDIDAKLVVGAAVFGVGWGLGGYCPGPAVTSLPTGGAGVIAFVLAMLVGSWLTGRAESKLTRGEPASPPS